MAKFKVETEMAQYPEATRRCITAAREKGIDPYVVIFESEVPTAQAAAQMLNTKLGQITNSLIFEMKGSKNERRRAVLVCSSGDHRVDIHKLATILKCSKNKVKSASSKSVYELTGYEAGGVAPCGFIEKFEACFVDDKVFRHEEIWCGAGVKPGMIRCTPQELLIMSGGIRVDISCEPTQVLLSPPETMGIKKTLEAETESIPHNYIKFEDQLIGDGESGIRWFPERAFDFYAQRRYKELKTAIIQDQSSPVSVLPFSLVIKQDPGHVGGIVWDAETLLAHHLMDSFRGSPIEDPKLVQLPLFGKRVLELGSGTGLSGIVACKLGAFVQFTELPEAMNLLQDNVKSNLSTPPHEYQCSSLKWGNENQNIVSSCIFDVKYDIILVADCVYLPEFYQDLYETILAGSKDGTMVFVSFEQRRRNISGFFDQFSTLECTQVLNDDGDHGSDDGQGSAGSVGHGGGGGCDSGNNLSMTDELSSLVGSVPRLEHEPGSDGRSPLNAFNYKLSAKTHDHLVMPLSSKLSWLSSPLIETSTKISKTHLAKIKFNSLNR